jgi:hypothetical protein
MSGCRLHTRGPCLRGALARIGRTIPTYRNIGVDTAVASIFANTIKSVDAAIKAGDPAQFPPLPRPLLVTNDRPGGDEMAWDVFIRPLVADLCRLVCGTRSAAIQKYLKPADRVACTAARNELPLRPTPR